MNIEEKILREARGWLGTPFRHQGRKKSTSFSPGGVDCLGLLVGVAGALKLPVYDRALGRFVDVRDIDNVYYGHFPDGGWLVERLNALLDVVPLEEISPGNAALFKVDGRVQHLGLIGDYSGGGLSLIHAYAPARKVVEHRFDAKWRDAMVAAYSFSTAFNPGSAVASSVLASA